jgi:predicted NUDIX family phosphoesterase
MSFLIEICRIMAEERGRVNGFHDRDFAAPQNLAQKDSFIRELRELREEQVPFV